MVTKEKVACFWNKFRDISEAIVKEPNNSTLINKLDEDVNELGEFDWEYGPSNIKEYYFCLSPNFQKELSPIIEEIISVAPELKDWEFLAYKPKKEWVGEWMMLNDDGEEIIINSEDWECMVYKFQDGTYDLDVKINQDLNTNDKTFENAVDVLLTNVLGEKKYMELVVDVKIVEAFEKENKDQATLVKHLDRYITYN